MHATRKCELELCCAEALYLTGTFSIQMLSRATRLQRKRVLWAWTRNGAVRAEVGEPRNIARYGIINAAAEKVVGVHVRHGDKKTESAIIPVEQYLEAAKVGILGQSVSASHFSSDCM